MKKITMILIISLLLIGCEYVDNRPSAYWGKIIDVENILATVYVESQTADRVILIGETTHPIYQDMVTSTLWKTSSTWLIVKKDKPVEVIDEYTFRVEHTLPINSVYYIEIYVQEYEVPDCSVFNLTGIYIQN